MDLANVPWLLEELLKRAGRLLKRLLPQKKKLKSSKKTQKEWEDFKKKAEQEYADKNATPLQQTLRVLHNFKRAAPHAWLDIEIDDISDRQMESLVNRDKNFDAEKARRFCRLLVAEEEELKREDEDCVLLFNTVLAELLQAFWFQMEPLVDSESFISLAHWYC